jgi:hypothetical protein
MNEDQAKERGSLIPIVRLRIKPNSELSGLQKGIARIVRIGELGKNL